MKIEPNKFYRTRDGRKARVLCTDAPRSECPALGYVEMPTGCIQLSWSKEGAWIGGTESSEDLIAEWIDHPEVDWSAMPDGSVAIARGLDGKWRAYASLPKASHGCGWVLNVGKVWLLYPQHCPKFKGDWRQSLVERPS